MPRPTDRDAYNNESFRNNRNNNKKKKKKNINQNNLKFYNVISVSKVNIFKTKIKCCADKY